jgi:uncharacterized protein (DUF305 family)
MHIRLRTLLYAGLLLTAAAFSVAAQQAQQQPMMQHGRMMGMHGPAMGQAMQRMQQGMGEAMSGDPDVDFARMMIPHHQGAIDMARSQLEHGKDPKLRQMAQEIIGAQEREIATLKEWLAQHPR